MGRDQAQSLALCFPLAGGSVRCPLPAMGVFCDDGPSAKDSCVSKRIAFVFLKYLIRSILHSRKYVYVGFLRSLNEVINT